MSTCLYVAMVLRGSDTPTYFLRIRKKKSFLRNCDGFWPTFYVFVDVALSQRFSLLPL